MISRFSVNKRRLYIFSFQVVSGTEIRVTEGGDPGQYVVRPTVPVLCPVGFDDCVLSLEVHVPRQSDGTPAVCNGEVSIKGEMSFFINIITFEY